VLQRGAPGQFGVGVQLHVVVGVSLGAGDASMGTSA